MSDAPSPDHAAEPDPFEVRRALVLGDADPRSGRSLEIGPLDSPLITRDMGDVRYVDIRDRDGVADYYRDDPSVDTSRIPEIDYWLTRDDGSVGTLAEVAAAGAPFERVVASHVIEHVPDMIGWLQDVAEVIVDDGELILVVPDLRFCFDALRPGATVGQVLQAHEDRDRIPSIRAVYDFGRTAVEFTAGPAWQGKWPPDTRNNPMPRVIGMLERQQRGEYVDCHVWPMTPIRFTDIMEDLLLLGRIDFDVERVTATPYGHHEFYVTLRRFPRDGDREARSEASLARLAELRDALPDEDRTWPQQVREAELLEVQTDLERRLAVTEEQLAAVTAEGEALRAARDRAWAQRNHARERLAEARTQRKRARAKQARAVRQRDRARQRVRQLAGQLERERATVRSRVARRLGRRRP